MSINRVNMIKNILEETFSPVELNIEDESHKHIGHVGARSGKGHFKIKIVSSSFKNMPVIKRQRLIYRALVELMDTDIHALSMSTLAPDEVE